MIYEEEIDGSYIAGLICEDTLVAVQAAVAMADRFKKPVIIQEDLSVVLAENKTKAPLEIFYPKSY